MLVYHCSLIDLEKTSNSKCKNLKAHYGLAKNNLVTFTSNIRLCISCLYSRQKDFKISNTPKLHQNKLKNGSKLRSDCAEPQLILYLQKVPVEKLSLTHRKNLFKAWGQESTS